MNYGPVPVQAPEGIMRRLQFTGEPPPDALTDQGEVVGVNQVLGRHRPGQDFFRPVAENLGHGGIHIGEAPVLNDVHPGQRPFRNHAITGLALFQGILGLLAPVDIPEHCQDAVILSDPDRFQVHFHPENSSGPIPGLPFKDLGIPGRRLGQEAQSRLHLRPGLAAA